MTENKGNEIIDIDEKELPLVVSKRLELLEKTNKAYAVAKIREKEARDKVNSALTKADALIDKAKGVGNNKAETHSFFGHEWTKKSDEIDKIKENLREMIECGIESAEAQKELVQVQSALAESQTSILQVQEIQIAYQKQIADVTKFLFGLCASNRAGLESIWINLEAALTGASKERIGEMAHQQLLLAVDQIKNQENLIRRTQRNEEHIDSINKNVAGQGESIEKITKKNSEQDNRIEKLERIDKDLVEKGIERDRLLHAGEEYDKKQDVEIARQAKVDAEHEKRLNEGEKKDRVQDAEIARQAQKDKELEKKIDEQYKRGKQRDKLLSEGAEKDKKQDAEIARQAAVDAEHDRRINEGEEKDKLQDAEIARQAEVDAEHARRLNEGEEKDKLQDAEIARQAEVDAEHARRLNEGEEKDKLQDAEIARQAEVSAEHDKLIEEIQHNYFEQKNVILDLQEKYDLLEKQINSNQKQSEESIIKINNRIDDKASKVLSIVSLITGLAALVITIIQFFV